MTKGSIKWPNEGVMVVWGNDFSSFDNVLGMATDIRREEDGWLTAEFVLDSGKGQQINPDDINTSFFWTIYANQIEEEGKGFHTVTSCNLLTIFACVEPDPWAEMPPVTDPICPECNNGKHVNCNGQAWDEVQDDLVECACTDVAHRE